jgi:3-oxoadipate enol-lactonase
LTLWIGKRLLPRAFDDRTDFPDLAWGGRTMTESIGRRDCLYYAALAACVIYGIPAAGAASKINDISAGFAAVEGARLYYEIAGSGASVVLIHGNAGDRRHWDLQFPQLAKKFRVIRFDARGYGLSSVPVEDVPYTDHEDLAALLDQLGVVETHLVGWSMGSATAIDFAIRFPERTLSVTALGPWVAGYASSAAHEVFAGFAQVVAAARQRGPEGALRAFVDAPFFAATTRDSAARAQFERIGADYSFWAFSHRDPRRSLDPPATKRLAEIGAPTFVLTGEHDIPACIEISELIDRDVRNSTRIVVAGAGHLLQMERAAEVNQYIERFLVATQRASP